MDSARSRGEHKTVIKEDRLWESDRWFREIFKKFKHGIVYYNLEGYLLECNHAFGRMLGYERSELQNTHFRDISPERHYQMETRLIQQHVLLRGSSGCYEKEYVRKDGTVFSAELEFHLVREASGRPIGMWAVVRDITERQRILAAVESYYRRRGDPIAQHTSSGEDLMTQQTNQREMMAAVMRLSAATAQQINTPLYVAVKNLETLQRYSGILRRFLLMHDDLIRTATQTAPELLTDQLVDIGEARAMESIDLALEDQESVIQEARDGLELVWNVVQNLRTFSQTCQPSTMERCSLNELICASLAVLNGELISVASVHTELAPIPSIQCEPTQIKQCLLNVLSNAIQAIRAKDASEKGHIAVHSYQKEGSAVCEIHDSGMGIPPEHRAHVFEPLYSTRSPGCGAGLGLSVCHDVIVNKHGGTIGLTSDPGNGTQVIIRLPIHGSN